MSQFWLIQRGNFIQRETIFESLLIGPDQIISLDYMGSSEFEFGAIPKAYRRIMHDFTEYDVFHTEIFTPEHDELMVFCNKDYGERITQGIRKFIEMPYRLKEYSELEKVPKAKKEDTSYDRRRSNFWWCIDISESYGDWMAFLQSELNRFKTAVKNDYQDWWMKKTPKGREEEYNKSLRW